MRNKIYFLLVLFATAVAAVFGGSDFARFLLGFEFLLVIALFAFAQIARQCVRAALCAPVPEARRAEPVTLEVRLENRGVLPISGVRVALQCKDAFDGAVVPLRGTAALDASDEVLLRFTVQAKHYGLLTVWGEKIAVSDPLGVYSPRLGFPEQEYQIAVLPEFAPSSAQHTQKGGLGELDDAEESYARGDDPSTAYELRKYQSGEPLRNVHWKMTAKTDEFMVKEFERAAQEGTTVILDLDCGEKPYARTDWDAFLETVASFAAREVHSGRHFQMLWIDAQARLYQVQVRDETSAKEALTALLRMKPHKNAGKLAYKEKLGHEAYSRAVCIDLWGQIKRETTQ